MSNTPRTNELIIEGLKRANRNLCRVVDRRNKKVEVLLGEIDRLNNKIRILKSPIPSNY